MVAGVMNRPSKQTEGNAVIKGGVLFLLMPTLTFMPFLVELCMTVASTG